MAVMASVIGTVVPRRRYVKIPETRLVKQIRDQWTQAMAGLDTTAALFEALLKSDRLTICRYKWHGWCAVLNCADSQTDANWANAVSGWGDTPASAQAELAFRWNCVMRCSWDPENWDSRAAPLFQRARTVIAYENMIQEAKSNEA